MELSPSELLTFLEKHARHPLSAREILSHFDLSRPERQAAARLLKSLVRQGRLIRLKGGRYSLPRQVNLIVGTVSVHRDGYGFVARDDGKGGDIFVPARSLREVMNGDRVAVRLERRGGRPEGRVVKVVQRAHRTVVGRFEEGRRFGYVVPADPRLSHDLIIPEKGAAEARPGQIVLARIDTYPSRNRNPEGSIVRIFGEAGDPEVEILTVAHKYGLPSEFPPEIEAMGAALPDRVSPEEHQGREDLRRLPLVTIDGETARDFDDAVAVREEDEGRIRLWVAIADVAHYVEEGTALDREAYLRGTSVYFPGRCIPMLPEPLSNGICSLNPAQDRLAMVAEMVFDRDGHRLDSRFYPAVIKSHARLTYDEVGAVLVDRREEAIARIGDLVPHLETMEVLARRLMQVRRQRGSLDFDLPEAEIVLDLRGRPEDVVRSERTIAHRLIEEFMLAANEAVATFLTENRAPLLYRIHEEPDLEKLQDFQAFIAHFNCGLVLGAGGVEPKQLQKALAEVEGRPEERVVNHILLRSMKQARYAPENAGHFGLATDCYCHFTSPIRRYPDLVVHRVLRQVLRRGGLSEKRRQILVRSLPEIGESTSQSERRAMEAEREIVDLKKCQFMSERIGEEFDGIVAGVQPFGFFVELKAFFVEGLVHVSSLSDDFYHYEENLHRLVGQNRRRIFQVGDEVRIRVAGVSKERREIDFHLSDLDPNEGKRTRRRQDR